MKLKVFSVFDSKVSAFMRPIYYHSAGEAMRSLIDAASGDHIFARHPADFHLFELGVFDDQDGQTTNHEAKINLGTILEIRGQPAAPPAELFPHKRT